MLGMVGHGPGKLSVTPATPTPSTSARPRQSPDSLRLGVMPWWTWIVIWVALLALTLLVLAALGYYLFRKVKALLKEIEQASAVLDRTTNPPAGAEGTAREPQIAVFRDPALVREEGAEGKALRVAYRRERRIRRRVDRGQPVSLRDLPHV